MAARTRRLTTALAAAVSAAVSAPTASGFAPARPGFLSRGPRPAPLLPQPQPLPLPGPSCPAPLPGRGGPHLIRLFMAGGMSREELESLTVKALKDMAKDAGLGGYSTMKKAELVDLLAAAPPPAAAEEKEGEDEDDGEWEWEYEYEYVEGEGEEDEDMAEEETVDEAAAAAAAAEEEEEEMVVEMVEAAAAEEEKEEEPEEDPEEEEAQEADGPRTEALTIENRESFAHEMARLTNDGAPPAQDEEVSPGVETLREYLKYSDYGIKKMQDERKAGERILGEIEGGDRPMPAWYHEDFVEEKEVEEDDVHSIAVDEWGAWDERDLGGPSMQGDWDSKTDPDPNVLNPDFEHVTEIPKDEDGVELGYDPVFGSWHPVDERTIVNPSESYIIDAKTANATSVPKEFPDDDDPEVSYNADVKAFRKSLKIVETYVDEWTGLEHPRHVARWHGNPPLEQYPDKPFTNNRFTKAEDKTDFSKLDPFRARKKAVELARAKNNEWLPKGASAEFHHQRTKIFAEKGILAGSLFEGDMDEEVVAQIGPALDVLGDVADLLSIQENVFRFHYHGLIKNRRGMAAWAETLIKDCGIECSSVIFETGTRKRDPIYDSAMTDTWHGPY